MYRPVDKIPDFPALERAVLALWSATDAFGKLREKNRGGKPWSFLDGPITANNPMGVHHAWGRSYKDMFQRYHAMNGRELRYQNGFDCQGLWVEVEVEKELGFKDKHDIVRYGLDEFVRRCKERVLKFAARQTSQSVRLGMWMEWDDPETLSSLREALEKKEKSVTVKAASGKTVSGDPEDLVGRLGSPELGGSYFTFSTENNYTIWTFLKKCHDEGFIYRGADVMPWCFRCGTGLSQMEVAEGRAITKHTSVFVRFPIVGREKEALLVWTTTPWTLTSNVAAAVNVEMTYLKVRHGEWTYYVGKGNFERARVQNLEAGGHAETHTLHTVKTLLKGSGELEVLGELKGAELVGLRYTGPFDHFEAEQKKGGLNPFERDSSKPSAVDCHRVIPWSEVSDAEGTGIVHIAPGCGAEDQRLGRDHDLVAVAPLDESGRYVEGFGPLTGKHVMEVTDFIVNDLRERGLLVAKESYPHVYPHCWRCKQELVFRLVDEWFIRMDWRDRIQKIVPEIRWIPPDGEAREQDWLKNMGDWMISKKRFWGLALPIWKCEPCDWFTVIGSREELKERAVDGWSTFEGHTPHRPWIDAVKVKCEKCGGHASRVEDVGNPWLDAGIVPYSTVHYNTDPAYWQKWFPADFVVESFPGQFRNWFYSLLAMSAMMSRRPPFKVLLGHALVRDARGEEMHKSKGNAIAFDEAADVLGAEVMRYLYAAQNPVQNLNFPDLPKTASAGKSSIDGEVRSKLLTFWNCYSFFVTYARADGWKPDKPKIPVAERSELDRWILSRLHRLVADARAAFDDYALYRLIERLERFHDDLSNWYLRRSRRRFWKAEADADKESAYQTLYDVLTTEVRVLAPLLPFLAEHMYQNLVRSVDESAPVSVHLTEYPVANAAAIDETLEAQIDCVIRIKNLALKLRNDAKIRARQPLAKLLVRPRGAEDRAVLSSAHFTDQILDECNLKALELIDDETALGVTYALVPKAKVIGQRHGKRTQAIVAAVKAGEAVEIEPGRFAVTIDGDRITLADEVERTLLAPAHLTVGLDAGSFAALDTTLTPELEREGIARDFNRAAQDRRKALDLDVSDRIRVRFSGSDAVARAIEENREFLIEELLADTLEHVPTATDATAKVAGEDIGLSIERA